MLFRSRRAQHAIAVECQQAGEEAGPRRFRRRLQREHLHKSLANFEVFAVPRHRALDYLPVHAGIAAGLVTLRPFLKVEQIAEELERFGPAKESQAQRTTEMTLKNDRCLLKLCKHPRCVGSMLLRLTLKRIYLRRLQREAPMQVDAAEACRLLKERETINCEYLRGGIRVLGLSGKIEAGHGAGVLIEA